MDKNKNYFKKVDVFRSGKRVKFKEDIQGCRREMENVRIRDELDNTGFEKTDVNLTMLTSVFEKNDVNIMMLILVVLKN